MRLRKIKGQIEDIEKMVEAGFDTSTILDEVVCVRQALKSFGGKELQFRIRSCIQMAAKDSDSQRDLRRLQSVLMRYVA